MKKLSAALLVLLLGSCASPADVQYCTGFGFPVADPEYARCLDYFHQQQALFDTDHAVCSAEANYTYPPSLYDRGHYEYVHGGFGPRGWYGGQEVRVSPDYAHNAEVDNLRMRIIQPCMQAHGWLSGQSWQAGRLGKPVKGKPATSTKALPWLGK
jgi:hypothetical protein